MGVGQRRYYLCPEDLIKIENLPKDWGLIYSSGKQMKIIHKANNQEANVQTERAILLSVIKEVKC